MEDKSEKVSETSIASSPKVCFACSAALEADASFCSHCGKRCRAARRPLSARGLGVVVAVALSVWGVSAYTAWFLAGEKPTRSYSDLPASHAMLKQAPALNSNILSAKDVAEREGSNLDAWRKLEMLVKQEITLHPEQGGGYLPLLLQALEALQGLEPENTEVLIELADIYFQIRDFAESTAYYRKALKVRPEDPEIMARLASSLSFQKKNDEAISLLQKILQTDPEHFQARAYLAIALSQKGDSEAAIREGETALAYAPTEEAHERFAAFLEKLKAPAGQNQNGQAQDSQGTEQAEVGPPSMLSQGAQVLVDHVQQNPIAGPKLVDAQQDGPLLKLTFVSFPMEKMPPFAKAKFFKGLEKFTRENQIQDVKSISFLDKVTGKQMEQLSLEVISKAE